MTSASDLSVAAPARPERPPRSSRVGSLAYQASLDGLRAVAVLLVMLYHGGVDWAHGGFLGVDIFFVLSGYLITTLLLQERARWGAIDLRAFWMRRARRLLPALFVVLAAVGLAAPLFARPDRLDQLRGDGLATLAYVANWRFIATGQSYFDQFAAPSPFRHMWSLGIEEQWYWFFPLLLLLLIALSQRRRRRLATALALLTVASAAWMAWLAARGGDPSYLYYATGTRVQELLVGSVLAVLAMKVRGRGGGRPTDTGLRWLGHAETYAGGVGVVAVVLLATDTATWLYRGGFLLLCVCVALLLDGLTRAPHTVPARALSWRPVVLVGVVSYGLYLWHWPLFLLLTPDRTGLGGLPLLSVRFAATGLVALASYRLLERPVRSGLLTRRFAPAVARGVVLVSVLGVVVALLVGTSGGVSPAPIERSGAVETRLVSPNLGQQSLLIVGDSPGRFLSWYLPRDVLSGYAISESTTIGCGLLPQTVVIGDTTTAAQPQCDGYSAEWHRAASWPSPISSCCPRATGSSWTRRSTGRCSGWGPQRMPTRCWPGWSRCALPPRGGRSRCCCPTCRAWGSSRSSSTASTSRR